MHSFVIGPDAFDVVVVSGKDAERFLQGQLTCNVAELAEGYWTYGACCNNKGRVIAAFTLVRQHDNFYLCMTQGVAQLLITALQKYIPFFKCTMVLQHGSHKLYGVTGKCVEKAIASTADGAATDKTLRQPAGDDEGWLCLLNGATPCALWWSSLSTEALHGLCSVSGSPSGVAGSLEEWEALGLLRGEYPFGPHDSGEHTPQELHYDHSGHVSFSKGCYTGQEIVARMHYRGKPKKQLYLLQLDSTLPIEGTKQPITDGAGTVVGTLLLTRQLGGHRFGLAQLSTDFPSSFETLVCAGRPVAGGSPFEAKAIQLSTLFSS